MKRILVGAGAAVLAFSAMADDMMFRQGDVSIRLTQAPCVLPNASEALTTVATPVQAAEVTEGSAKMAACWVIDSDGDVLVVTRDMRGAYIAGALFKREPGV